MLNYRIALSILIMMFLPFLGSAQDSDFGNWILYFGNKDFNEKWNWHHEVQYRNYDAIGDLEQLLLRTGIGYNLSENNNNVLLGYGFIASENYTDNQDKVSVNEHRIYQQFITKHQVGSVKLSHRYRFEQRFVEDDFRMRFRYFLSLNVPLCKTEEDVASKWYLSAYNEIFLNTETSIFDRNRLYGGLGYRLSKNVRFELGYMNQFFETSSRDQLNVITFVNF